MTNDKTLPTLTLSKGCPILRRGAAVVPALIFLPHGHRRSTRPGRVLPRGRAPREGGSGGGGTGPRRAEKRLAAAIGGPAAGANGTSFGSQRRRYCRRPKFWPERGC